MVTSDRIASIPDTNTARKAQSNVPNFGTDYVASGGRFTPNYDSDVLAVGSAVLFISEGDRLYHVEVDSRGEPGDLVSLTSGATNDIYYSVDQEAIVATTGTAPSGPSLRIGTVDTAGETHDDTVNRERTENFGSVNTGALTGGVAGQENSIDRLSGALLESTTIEGESSFTFNADNITDAYDTYVIEIPELIISDSGNNIRFRVVNASGPVSSADYSRAGQTMTDGGAVSGFGNEGASSVRPHNSGLNADKPFKTKLQISRPRDGINETLISGESSYVSGSGAYERVTFGGIYDVAEVLENFEISGTVAFDAVASLYGVSK